MSGDANAQHQLGLLYEQGKGVEKDPAKALEWYRKAAQQNRQGAAEKVAELEKAGQAGANPQSSGVECHGPARPCGKMFRSGTNLLKLGNINGAKAMFSNAVRLDPSLKPKVDEALSEHGESL